MFILAGIETCKLFDEYKIKWKLDEPILKWKFSDYGGKTNYADYGKGNNRTWQSTFKSDEDSKRLANL